MSVFECSGEVTNIERSKIPYVNIMSIKCDCGEMKVSIHDEVLTFKKGDKVRVVIDDALPVFKENDFCGVLYLVKKEGELTITSVGGFVITFEKCNPPLQFNTKYYICIMHA